MSVSGLRTAPVERGDGPASAPNPVPRLAAEEGSRGHAGHHSSVLSLRRMYAGRRLASSPEGWTQWQSDTDLVAVPDPGRVVLTVDVMLPDVQPLRDELKELVHSWEYAYAMGHGCTVGDHPDFQATRRRAADLRARIAELTE